MKLERHQKRAVNKIQKDQPRAMDLFRDNLRYLNTTPYLQLNMDDAKQRQYSAVVADPNGNIFDVLKPEPSLRQ